MIETEQACSSLAMPAPTLSLLPEDCISLVLSLTSPQDACRLSLVSPEFRSAAKSDVVWIRFLPSDYEDIISRSVSPVIFSSKKDLYFRLCESPLLVDGGARSFELERVSGKKRFMIGARESTISWANNPQFWEWISPSKSPSLPISRFNKVAGLRAVCWLDIRTRIEKRLLSPNTSYTACLVYTIADSSHGLEYPVKVSLTLSKKGSQVEEPTTIEGNVAYLKPTSRYIGQLAHLPLERGDQWKEVEIGEFFNDPDDGIIEMRVSETELLNWKSGLVVQGFELRPKLLDK